MGEKKSPGKTKCGKREQKNGEAFKGEGAIEKKRILVEKGLSESTSVKRLKRAGSRTVFTR